MLCFFFFKQKTAYEMRISDWSSDVCSSDLPFLEVEGPPREVERAAHQINLACHARCQRRAAERDVGLPFGFEPHAGDINLVAGPQMDVEAEDRKSTRLNSSH